MKRIFLFLSYMFIVWIASSQDLIQRSQLGIPADMSQRPNVIGDQIFHKNGLEEIELFDLSTEKNNTGLNGVSLNIRSERLKSLHKKKDYQIRIPVSADRQIVVKVYPYDITSSGYKLYQSDNIKLEPSRISFYKGIVADDPRSAVQITVTDSDLRMVLFDNYGTYSLGPLSNSSQNSYFLFSDSELGSIPFECMNDESSKKYIVDYPKLDPPKIEKVGECVKIHVEMDHTSFNNLGGASNTEAFALGSFAQVAILYEHLYNGSSNSIPVEISSVRVWETADPYSAQSGVSSALNRVAAVVNPQQYNADLVHLVSANNSNSYSGIAYVSCRGSGPCKATTIGTGNPFAVSQTQESYGNASNYSWTIGVLAHEMGHNMGSPHSHDCVWGPNNNVALDGCVSVQGGCTNPGYPNEPGTIMSYCHFGGRPGISFLTAFGSEIGNHLYDEYVYAAANFLEGCSDPGPPEEFCASFTPITSEVLVDFESNDISIWSNISGDDKDWERDNNGTPSSNTGPANANEGDYYYYVEASGSPFNYTSILTSGCINLSQLDAPALEFDYHMFGADMGSLRVTVSDESQTTEVFVEIGNQGNQWQSANIDLGSYTAGPISINIVAQTGTSWGSDIAIDRLSITQEVKLQTCDNPIANNFADIGPCEYTCNATNTSTVTSSNANSTIISNSSVLATVSPGPVEVNSNNPVFWRANGSIELNQGFSINAGSELNIEVGACIDNSN